MKKRLISVLVIIITVFLTGCSEEYIKITDAESEAIAQYSAHLLMKYDKNKNDDARLLDYDDFIDEINARKPEPTATPIITEEPTVTEEPGDSLITDVPDSTDTQVDTEPTPVPYKPEYTLSEVLGCNKNFSVEYQDIKVTDSYSSSSEYFSLQAPADKKVAAVSFKLTNTSKKDKDYDAAKYRASYKLSCEDDKSYEPALSLLSEDLQFYNESLKSGESKDVVIIFFIPSDSIPKTLRATGTDSSKESKSCTINISNNSEVENGN